jgi:Holliday junction resolvase-like predicted endonuclease
VGLILTSSTRNYNNALIELFIIIKWRKPDVSGSHSASVGETQKIKNIFTANFFPAAGHKSAICGINFDYVIDGKNHKSE